MGDEAHVGLVDAHAEGDGGDHHHAVLAQEAVLVRCAHLGVQAGVVGQRVDALPASQLGGLLDPLARLAVDDAGVARVLARDEAQQLRRGSFFSTIRVADVGPVEAADELAALASCSRSTISARVVASAVAVSAMRGTSG